MNRISIYILLIFIFLGLSKSFSPSENQTLYIKDEHYLEKNFSGSPISIILISQFRVGFLIKTYFQKYKIIHGFKHPEEVIVRASKRYWQRYLPNLGMSIYRKTSKELPPNLTPLPPGSLYLGNPAYGKWVYQPSGDKQWKFHRAYRTFPELFGWGEFRPNLEFYKRAKIYERNAKSFFGLNDEFGANGAVTKAFLEKDIPIYSPSKGKAHFSKLLKNLFLLPKQGPNHE